MFGIMFLSKAIDLLPKSFDVGIWCTLTVFLYTCGIIIWTFKQANTSLRAAARLDKTYNIVVKPSIFDKELRHMWE
jgi:hypothetical protein